MNDSYKDKEIARLEKLLKVALHTPNNYRRKYQTEKNKNTKLDKKIDKLTEELNYWKSRFKDEVKVNVLLKKQLDNRK
jgi:LytS/YehU family sensor histidine kinase